MAIRLSFFKTIKHNRFEYKPVYFDKRKEELEKKIQKHKEKKELIENNNYEPKIKGRFTGSFVRSDAKKQNKNANLRIVAIITFISIITYFILKNGELINYMLEILLSGKK